jgi:hypothetical protein
VLGGGEHGDTLRQNDYFKKNWFGRNPALFEE